MSASSVAPPSLATGASSGDTEPGGLPPWRRVTSLEVLCAVLVLALLAQGPLIRMLDVAALRTGATVFVAVCVQAMPFLVLGVLVSGLIAAFVPPAVFRRLLPRRAVTAVPVAGAAGMVLARFLGSMGTAMVTGWLWARFGRAEWIAERARLRCERAPGHSSFAVFTETARHDLVSSGGFLVLGGLTAAAVNVLVPASWMASLAGQILLGILVMARFGSEWQSRTARKCNSAPNGA